MSQNQINNRPFVFVLELMIFIIALGSVFVLTSRGTTSTPPPTQVVSNTDSSPTSPTPASVTLDCKYTDIDGTIIYWKGGDSYNLLYTGRQIIVTTWYTLDNDGQATRHNGKYPVLAYSVEVAPGNWTFPIK
jgi:hypothetical protein